jgi:hypothetical protein
MFCCCLDQTGVVIPKEDKPKRRYTGFNSVEHILPGAEANGGRLRNVANCLRQPSQQLVLGKRLPKQVGNWGDLYGEQGARRNGTKCALPSV